MTLDKNGIDELIGNIRGIFESAFEKVPDQMPGREWLKNNLEELLINQTLKELEELAKNRPPKFFLIGRTQTGKSSLINAISGQKVAETGDDTDSVTTVATEYSVDLRETNSKLIFVDSRGYFESRELNNSIDAVEQLNKEIKQHKPDIILHVLNSEIIAAAKNDFDVFKTIQNNLKQQTGAIVPTIIILNKIDKTGKRREWPPEKFINTSSLIEKKINKVAENLSIEDTKPIDFDNKYTGYEILNDKTYCGIIPTCSDFDEPWNIDSLKDFIAVQLPNSSLLQASQALKTTKGLKRISSSYIKMFAAIAFGIGAIPNIIVGANTVRHMLVLTPLQIFLIMIIAGLSGRKLSRDNATEFLGLAGTNVGAGVVFQYIFSELVTLVPVLGSAWGAGVAASGTWMIGKAAEYYFFDGEKVTKEVLKKKWEEVKENIIDSGKDWEKKFKK